MAWGKKQQQQEAPEYRLPHAEVAVHLKGEIYFQELYAQMGEGWQVVRLHATPDDDWGQVQVQWRGERIGYISGPYEAGFLAEVQALEQSGWMVTANCWVQRGRSLEDVTSGGGTSTGNWEAALKTGYPERLAQWIRASSPEERGTVDLAAPSKVRVTLKESAKYQAALARLPLESPLPAEIVVELAASGKYAGQPGLIFKVGEETVGTVGARYAADERRLFDVVLRGASACTVTVRASLSNEGVYGAAEINLP